MEDGNISRRKGGVKPAYIIIAAVAAILILAVMIVVTGRGNTSRQTEKKLELARHYLEELDYEQAIATFEAVIAIDPKCVDAYLGLADAYEQTGDLEKAKEALQNGIDSTGDAKLAERLEDIDRKISEEQTRLEAERLAAEEAARIAEEEKLAEEAKRADGFINDEGYFVFGLYEQDGDESNGPEPIEWQILDENRNGTLLVSRYVLDCQPYNTVEPDVTWETCSLRSWMNNDFYNAAFDDDMKARINTVTVVNENNQKWGTPGGNSTSDKIFALSVSEILKYYDFNSWYTESNPYHWKDGGTFDWFGFSEHLIIPATAYAISRGVHNYTITENDYYNDGYDGHGLADEGYNSSCIGRSGSVWWLRSPGYDSYYACYVFGSGYASADSTDGLVCLDDIGVRPALYINM